jgi:hypothetical protein
MLSEFHAGGSLSEKSSRQPEMQTRHGHSSRPGRRLDIPSLECRPDLPEKKGISHRASRNHNASSPGFNQKPPGSLSRPDIARSKNRYA